MKYLILTREPTVLSSDNVVFFDVDETLVNWHIHENEENTITVSDPYIEDKLITLSPHQRNIDLLLRNYGQQRTIVVWSLGGALWAEAVVKALKLEKYVTLILTKPKIYVDDMDMGDWGSSRIYLSKHFSKPE